MKTKQEIVAIDKKFISALDQVKLAAKELGIKPNSDSGICKLIYPSSRSVISTVRSGKNHIPHVALINFAKLYNVNMNYFYFDDVPFTFDFKNLVPKTNNQKNKHLNLKDITPKDSQALFSPVNDSLAKYFKLESMINEHVESLDKQTQASFYNIIHIIQFDNTIKIENLEKIISDSNTQINELKNQLLSQAEKVSIAQENENKVLKKYIHKLED